MSATKTRPSTRNSLWQDLAPIGFDTGDGDLYRYVGNDPANAVDPSGLASDPDSPEEPYEPPTNPKPNPGPLDPDLERQVERRVVEWRQTKGSLDRGYANLPDVDSEEEARQIIRADLMARKTAPPYRQPTDWGPRRPPASPSDYVVPNSAPGAQGGYVIRITSPFIIKKVNLTKVTFSGKDAPPGSDLTAWGLVQGQDIDALKARAEPIANFLSGIPGLKVDPDQVRNALNGKLDVNMQFIPAGFEEDKSKEIRVHESKPRLLSFQLDDLQIGVAPGKLDVVAHLTGTIEVEGKDLTLTPLKKKSE